MRTTASFVAFVVTLGVLGPGAATASAQNREHLQMMAELRMLHEQQQQLQQVLAGLTETLKVITTRLDEQSGVTRRGFADQKVLIENVAESTRILREKADDSTVRLSRATQEIQALRQTVLSAPACPPAGFTGTGDPAAATGDPDAAPGTVPPPSMAPQPNVSPTAMWDRVYADYTTGQYDLAIEGFQAFIRTFPTSPQADDAQLYIGYSLYDAGRFADAAGALRKVISDYPDGDSVPRAWYKLGQTFEHLKQVDNARKAYETVVQNYPTAVTEHTLSRQALERLARRN